MVRSREIILDDVLGIFDPFALVDESVESSRFFENRDIDYAVCV